MTRVGEVVWVEDCGWSPKWGRVSRAQVVGGDEKEGVGQHQDNATQKLFARKFF